MHLTITLTLTCEEFRKLERLLHLARNPTSWCTKDVHQPHTPAEVSEMRRLACDLGDLHRTGQT